MRIKKENPKSQTLVYSVLDQLGKYYSLSKGLVAKKKEYKRLLKAELAQNDSLKKDTAVMQVKISKMKKVMFAVNDALKKDYANANNVKEAKDRLAREREEFIREKNRFAQERAQLIAERNALLREREELLRDRAAASEKAPVHKDAPPKQPVFAKKTVIRQWLTLLWCHLLVAYDANAQ